MKAKRKRKRKNSEYNLTRREQVFGVFVAGLITACLVMLVFIPMRGVISDWSLIGVAVSLATIPLYMIYKVIELYNDTTDIVEQQKQAEMIERLSKLLEANNRQRDGYIESLRKYEGGRANEDGNR